MPQAPIGTPITIQVTHDQVNTTTYDLVINGTVTDSKPVDPAGINFQFASGFTEGTYDIVVRAVGPGGTTPSDPVTLIIVPGAPAKPVVVIVVG